MPPGMAGGRHRPWAQRPEQAGLLPHFPLEFGLPSRTLLAPPWNLWERGPLTPGIAFACLPVCLVAATVPFLLSPLLNNQRTGARWPRHQALLQGGSPEPRA